MKMQGLYRLLELKKLEAGFAFVGDDEIDDIGLYKLDETPPERTLNKTVRRGS